MASPEEVTQLLIECGKGNRTAFDQLMPLVYAELHRTASHYMRMQSASHTLQTTALIHETYIRLAGASDKQWENRVHFFGVAAKAMRHILVDHARAYQTIRRGGEAPTVELDEGIAVSGERLSELVALDDAITNLAKLSQRQSEVAEMRVFWRVERGRNGGNSESVPSNRDAGLAGGEGLAICAIEQPGRRTWTFR